MAGQKPTEFDVRLGARLAEARRTRKMSQREIAAQIGISPAQLQKYEKGSNGIAARQLCQAAAAMGLDPAHLLSGLVPTAEAPVLSDLDPLEDARHAARRLLAFLEGAGTTV